MTASILKSSKTLRPADVGSHYDDLDKYYREIWGEHVHHGLFDQPGISVEQATLRLSDKIAEILNLSSDQQLLDIGCGYGGTARYFAEKYSADISAVTLSEKQLDYAKKQPLRGTGSINYLLADFIEQDFKEQSFDAIYAIECLAHIEDKAAAISKISALLAEKGTFASAVWLSKESPSKREKKYILKPICDEGRLPSLPTSEYYLELLRNNGFSNVNYLDLTPHVHRTWLIVLQRALKGIITNKEYRNFLFNSANENRVFLLTVPRLWWALKWGIARYGIITGTR